MTQEAPKTAEATKKKWLLPTVGVGVLAVAGGAYYVSQAGLDKALVKQKVDEYIELAKIEGRAHGRSIEVTYSDLEVTGAFTNKHVVIHQPLMTMRPLEESVSPKPQAGADSAVAENEKNGVVFTTDSLEIYPESVDFSAVRVALPQPLKITGEAEPDKSLLTISTDVPFAVSIAQENVGDVPYARITHQFPGQIKLNYLREHQAMGKEDATPEIVPVYEGMEVKIAAGSSFFSRFALDGGRKLGELNLDLKSMTVTPGATPENAISIGAVSVKWSHSINEAKQNAVTTLVSVGPVSASEELMPFAPLSFEADIAFEGVLPGEQPSTESQAKETRLQIKKWGVTAKDAGLNITADFVANPAEVLPVGNASFSLVNLPFIREQAKTRGVLSAETDSALAVLIEKVTGMPVDKAQNVEIPISREKGGAFKIGQTTFEELFATFLQQTGSKSKGEVPSVPPLPPEGKAKIPGQPLVDNSVRG